MKRMIFTAVLAFFVLVPETFGQDPGMPDSAIFGNLDGLPIHGSGDVPVWLKNDEDLTFFAIWFGAQRDSARIIPGVFFPPITSWDVIFDTLYGESPFPEYPDYSFILTMGWCDVVGDCAYPLNTDSVWQQIMVCMVWAPDDTSRAGDTTCFVAMWPGITSVQAGCMIIGPEGVDEEQKQPHAAGLLQIYPNPFNTRATISYQLPTESDVRIDIFDIAGRKTETIELGWQNTGAHLIHWDAGKCSSGIYFCRLTAGSYSETQRMVLLK